MNKKKLGILGGALIMIGVFLPIVKLPIIGQLSFFNLSQAKAILLLLVGGLAILSAVLNRHRLQLGTSLVCFVLIAQTCYSLSERAGELKAVFSGLSQGTVQESFDNINFILTLSYGIPMIGIGALLLLFTAVKRGS